MGNETRYRLIPRNNPHTLSIIIPVFNEEEVLPLLLARLKSVAASIDCAVEFLFVNDGSSDGTLQVLCEAANADRRVKFISLARNFGQQIAATAGLDVAEGDAVVLIDADLQDPPELIVQMLAEYRQGYDVVYAKRTGREGDSLFKRVTARVFYMLMRAAVYSDLPADTGDFRLMSRRVVNLLSSMRERHRFLRGMASWIGFPQTSVPFVREARQAGSTHYPFLKMLALACDAAISFSPAPIRAGLMLGTVLLLAGFAGASLLAYRWAITGPPDAGWWVLDTNLLGLGAVVIGISVVGEYVQRAFAQSQRRPLYTVCDAANLGADQALRASVPNGAAELKVASAGR